MTPSGNEPAILQYFYGISEIIEDKNIYAVLWVGSFQRCVSLPQRLFLHCNNICFCSALTFVFAVR
jgi:hypothetical protein